MIPTPVVNMNRISEAIAEATNFLGVNSGVILASTPSTANSGATTAAR